jgi:hypothetical protein
VPQPSASWLVPPPTAPKDGELAEGDGPLKGLIAGLLRLTPDGPETLDLLDKRQIVERRFLRLDLDCFRPARQVSLWAGCGSRCWRPIPIKSTDPISGILRAPLQPQASLPDGNFLVQKGEKRDIVAGDSLQKACFGSKLYGPIGWRCRQRRHGAEPHFSNRLPLALELADLLPNPNNLPIDFFLPHPGRVAGELGQKGVLSVPQNTQKVSAGFVERGSGFARTDIHALKPQGKREVLVNENIFRRPLVANPAVSLEGCRNLSNPGLQLRGLGLEGLKRLLRCRIAGPSLKLLGNDLTGTLSDGEQGENNRQRQRPKPPKRGWGAHETTPQCRIFRACSKERSS